MQIQVEQTERELIIRNYSRKMVKSYLYRLNVYPAYFLRSYGLSGVFIELILTL